jgi:NTE family protein
MYESGSTDANHEFIKILQNKSIFSCLSDEQLHKLLESCNSKRLSKSECLFKLGDDSDSLYIVTKGKLMAQISIDDTDEIIGFINIGQTVGELGAVTGKPRALSIFAATDCELLKIEKDNFIEFLEENCSIKACINIMNLIINRSQSLIKMLSNESINKHCLIAPLTKTDIPHSFIESLKESICPQHNIMIVDDKFYIDNNLDDNISNLAMLIERADLENKIVIFIIREYRKLIDYTHLYEDHSEESVFNSIDRFYGLMNHNETSELSQQTEKILQKSFAPFVSRRECIIYYPKDDTNKSNRVYNVLTNSSFQVKHHIHNQKSCYSRLLRYILGKPNGLVISGGGAKGWTSLGIIKALQEKKIPIDAIAGVSAGSTMCPAYAIYQDINKVYEMRQPVLELCYKIFSLSKLSYPLVSINNGKLLTNSFKEIYQDLKFEDLELPCFIISSNLTSGIEVMHNSGYIWEAIRSSAALPLVYPPYEKDGELYVDGGLLNHLPVDRMRQLLGKNGFIFSVNLSAVNKKEKYSFPPIITFWDGLKAKLGINHYKYPPFIENFLNSMLLGSSIKVESNIKLSDFHFSPDLSNYSLVELAPHKIDELIDIGYQYAIGKLKDIAIDPVTQIITKNS